MHNVGLRSWILATSMMVGLAVEEPIWAASSDTEVSISDGRLRGEASEGIVAFRGIPFAAPPLGSLRWRAPQPVKRWPGTRDAIAYRNDCMQLPFPSDAAPLGTTPAEDCLYANLWKPAGARTKVPVLVWIYGGGFVNGGASPPTYSGANLARQGVMVISFNYRVGRFGSFGHPQLTKADADKGLLVDYGYMDQLAMLKWVQRNVAAFGGDPANVTIVGESAGGGSVLYLLGSPMAKGLFKRAVIQSGGGMTSRGGTVAQAEEAGINFAKAKGIAGDDPDALAKLRTLPAEVVTDSLNMASSAAASADPRTYIGPVTDGKLAVDTPAAIRAGTWNKVALMVGATSADRPQTITGARDVADAISAQGVPTYLFSFSYVAQSIRTAERKGASHASDIPYWFNTVDQRYVGVTTEADRAAARISSTYLVNFVKTGDPNGSGLSKWEPHTPANASRLDIAAEGGAGIVRDPPAS